MPINAFMIKIFFDYLRGRLSTFVSEAMIFGKHAVGNQGKSSGHGENSLFDKFGRVYIF